MHRSEAVLAGLLLISALAPSAFAQDVPPATTPPAASAPTPGAVSESYARTLTLYSQGRVVATMTLPIIGGSQIGVQADRITIDEKNRKSTLSGNVIIRLTQDKQTVLRLNADEAVLQQE